MSPHSANERTLVVGIRHPHERMSEYEDSLAELVSLVETAGAFVVDVKRQDVKHPSPATFIGKGKVEEVARAVLDLEIELVAVDDELSPVQNRNLEDAWGVRVVDRTAVILDIFALRARTREGKLQVELAQLEYLGPRLVGRGQMLSQQAGRIGTRGPGETMLEYERRALRRRISILKNRIDDVKRHRFIHRQKRAGVPIPLVSLMGYTNAGKSTLMNKLTRAGVHVEDQLFSTLDPTVRRMRLPSGREILLADTVGFIKKLPHQLIASFKATFEEMAHADLLIEVVDAADSYIADRLKVVDQVLNELGLDRSPRIVVHNKADLCDEPCSGRDLLISARTGQGIDALIGRIDEMLKSGFKLVRFKLKHDQGEILSTLYRVGSVISVRHFGKTVRVDCELPEKFIGKFREFIV